MVRAVVDCGLSKAAAAGQFHITPKTVAKWVKRFRAEGVDGLRDRSSRPLSLPSQTAPATAAAIEALRRQRHTAKQIAAEVGVSPATVSRILRRLGLNRLSALEPAEPVRRYERENPGELIHIDIKKLGRIGSVGHRITGRYPGVVNQHHGIGWSSFTSALMTPQVSLSCRSCPTSARKALSPSLRPLSLTMPASA
jgi:transposase